ncbi:hypothetical protein [Dyadobacter sp. CY323]|uniref:hypothetical protein n=1 Tax=Dyadobacter sp. CY323 TaxID=2907302 RepID=UPI001F417D13|nr:hypothetical protein [Dyadobacter sp. CY323]MCE6992113.1 hypothetical protein [Dyadobacter sp. CY323]
MKNRIMSTLMSAALIILFMSTNPTASQENPGDVKTDTVPAGKPALSDSTSRIVSNDSLLNAVSEKGDRALEKVDANYTRGGKLELKLDRLISRQTKIRMQLVPVEIKASLPNPRPVTPLSVVTDSIQIKPVEMEKPSWWRRIFN